MIREIVDGAKKSRICEEILHDLPQWFGIDEATKEYIKQVQNYLMFALYQDDELVGFYSVRQENKETLDMYVLGVKRKYHHQGFGTTLQEHVFTYAQQHQYKYCMVLTLSASHPDIGYKHTRAFYHKMGFVDLYETNALWGKENPTQIMVKRIGE